MVAYQIPQTVVMKACEVNQDWQRVHAELRQIARKRSALDARELRLIREAIRIALWRHVGMTGIREYLEDVFGYGPKVASERVRVAEALDSMPALEAALDRAELSYSAVREISRIATSRTEEEWLGACREKNQRQVEELLAEREVGDRPGSPRKPDLRAKDRTYRGIMPATVAALELARRELEAEMGERLDDNQLLFLLANRAKNGSAPRKKAAAQVAVIVCPACQVGRQLAGNRTIALRHEELQRVFCDAQWIDITGDRRAIQDVTPALRAKVMLRDRGRCRVPGCRAAANIEVHQIVPRELGGEHTMENLIALCDGHHVAHHAGHVRIEGSGDNVAITNDAAALANLHVENRSDHVEPPVVSGEDRRRDAVLALTTLGFTKGEARRAVEEALCDEPASLEELVRAALRRCARSSA